MKCVNCIHCTDYREGYYWCNLVGEWELIEECIANDDEMWCDGYVEDSDDDFTA